MHGPPPAMPDASVLVIDANATSRKIIVAHLRAFGVGKIVQCSKPMDARRRLELETYDLVVCEQYFEGDDMTGQDLLDDLRRNQLLPFFTIFVMVTSEASYSKVAEAAESALDAYLLKPHTGTALTDRIVMARERKQALEEVFMAIDAEDFARAAQLCKERFEQRKPYWLHAARIGAELMLRIGDMASAQAMYEAVIEAKTVPWAKLGVARVQLANNEAEKASTTLEDLIEAEPGYTDAYDVMARAQFELGDFKKALETFKLSTRMTPSAINRLLKHGMMAYYVGERQEGYEMLERAIRIGQDSKLFDPQAWVLTAFAKLDDFDPRGLMRCLEGLRIYCERHPDLERPRHLYDLVHAMLYMQEHQIARALDEIRRMHKMILEPGFDFEFAVNLLSLMTRLAVRSIQLFEVDAAVDTLGLRFGSSRALTQLLACSVTERKDFVKRIYDAFDQVTTWSEESMKLCLEGKPQQAVEKLLEHGKDTCNPKLIESANLVLQRYADKIPDFEALQERANELREIYQTQNVHAGLGDLPSTGRAAGGISLPTAYRPKSRKPLLQQAEEARAQQDQLQQQNNPASAV